METLMAAFITIFFAEMGDKTQIVTLLMASCHYPLQVFLGAVSALTVLTGLASGLGSLFPVLIPGEIIAVLSGVLFIVIGVITYLRRNSAENISRDITCRSQAFLQTFALIFLAEMGDKTQLMTMSLAAVTGRPLLVFLGAVSAQLINHGLAVFLGDRIFSRFSRPRLQLISAFVFIGLGMIIIVTNSL